MTETTQPCEPSGPANPIPHGSIVDCSLDHAERRVSEHGNIEYRTTWRCETPPYQGRELRRQFWGTEKGHKVNAPICRALGIWEPDQLCYAPRPQLLARVEVGVDQDGGNVIRQVLSCRRPTAARPPAPEPTAAPQVVAEPPF